MSAEEPVCLFCKEPIEDVPVEARVEVLLSWPDSPDPPLRHTVYAHPQCAAWLRPPGD